MCANGDSANDDLVISNGDIFIFLTVIHIFFILTVIFGDFLVVTMIFVWNSDFLIDNGDFMQTVIFRIELTVIFGLS